MKTGLSDGFAARPKNKDVRSKYRSIFATLAIVALFLVLFFVTSFLQGSSNSNQHPTVSDDELYDTNVIHEAHLKFSKAEWSKVQPYGGPFGINGVGVGWFDVGIVLGSVFIHRGDLNKDDFFSKEEFLTLGETWYSEWKTPGDTALTMQAIDVGFNKESLDLRNINGLPNGIMRVLGVRTSDAIADLTFEGVSYPSVSVRYKGNGTLMAAQASLKRSFKIDLNDRARGRNVGGVSKFNLHSEITDAGFMNDVLAYRLYRDAKIASPRTSFTRVFLTVEDSLDNHYNGLYVILENVDNNFAQEFFGTQKGAMFKPVTPRMFEYLGNDWSRYVQTYDPKTPLSIQETSRIMEVCHFVTNASDEEFALKLGQYFDLDQLARYMAVTVFICDLDGLLGPGQNVYLYLHPKTMKLSFIPWDHDHSFGQMRGTQLEREQLSIMKPWINKVSFLERVYKVEAFMTLYKKYLTEFNETLFKPERLQAQVKELIPLLRPAVLEESDQSLKRFEFTVGLHSDSSVVDSAWLHGEERGRPMYEYVARRHKAIDDQLKGVDKGKVISSGNYPAGMMGFMFSAKLDANKDNIITHGEFMDGFKLWYKNWTDKDSGLITLERLRDGINADLSFSGPDPNKIKIDSVQSVDAKQTSAVNAHE